MLPTEPPLAGNAPTVRSWSGMRNTALMPAESP
jgi:hypothetical protein